MQRHVRRTFATSGTTALLAAALLTAPGAQAAAATTCQGKAVTIDGTGQATVTGTPSADVIAASLGATVAALAGDDTICIVPGAAATPTSVDAGEGDDSVDTTALPAGSTVAATLAAGDDSYAGGPGADHVTSGTAAQPNADKLALGAGDDVLTWHGVQAPRGAVDFGDGADTLVDVDGGVVSIDATPRKLDRGGATVLRWTGSVTTYVVHSTAISAGFAGTNGAETFVLRDPAAGATPTKVVADMAGGDDTATIRSNVVDGSSWAGGDGTDLFQVAHDYGELELNLRSGDFETGEPDVTADQSVKAFENAAVVTASAIVKGTHGPNVLNAEGCEVQLVGRAGEDTLGHGVDIEGAPDLACAGVRMVGRGGKDADRITGTAGADRLMGNRGDDTIDAMGGVDVIFGGADDDRLDGNAGKDKVRGGQGNDQVGGGADQDRVQGDKGNDRVLGNSGNDVLVGGLGFDRAHGGQGFDRCHAVERRWKCER